ncbi:hypothetical protein HHL24_17040 [Paraburkholderia sp. RP-4-7]|uniref:Uncharacterized protein n=1 Tax=Paraburkholderia polaris TaxID=2728848 RepID=A0A848IID6_9BURK|nr:hypothetical protein [Paraburkholderia polaris]NML99634.1 hypothetical protein [Paraburkholderia polaris]
MIKLPTFEHCPKDGTVSVTHSGYDIRTYAEVRSGQLTALLSVFQSCKLDDEHADMVIVYGLAEELAREVSGLVETFTRTDCLEVSHE